MSHYVEAGLGRWDEASLRLLPRGNREWATGNAARPVHVLHSGNRRLATLRRLPAMKQWVARIEGFEGTITPDMPAARMQKIPSSEPMTHIPAKPFKSLANAKKEVISILEMM